MFQNKLPVLLSLYFVLLLLYAVFSYSLTDPNLVLSSWPPYWQFQNWMWQHMFSNNNLVATSFLLIIVSLFGVFSWLILDDQVREKLSFVPTSKTWWIYLLVVSPLFFSYNALSHDIFNYIFNAKMIAVYQSNPHVQVALNFPTDEWTRFMHNTHTPAPYGYGWTVISLLPYFLGLGKFVTTWLFFRLFSVVSIGALYLSLQFLSVRITSKKLQTNVLALLFLNPLLLIEVISNGHNDLWMLFPALFSLGIALLLIKDQKKQWLQWFAVGLLLVFSISIKYATVVLLPVLLLIASGRRVVNYLVTERIPLISRIPRLAETLAAWVEKFWLTYVPLMCSLLLFIPLLTPRSQLFHSWYLLWPLVWLPLIKQTWWKKLLLFFSFTSLLRYVPWLSAGGFENYTVLYQQLITWSAVLLLMIVNFKKSSRLHSK